MYTEVPVTSLRRYAKSSCLDISVCFAKSSLPVGEIVMHRLRVSYSNAPLCHNLLSKQIRSYCKKLIASGTNRIVMPLRRCVIRCRLGKSDRIGIETCYVFHCAAVSSSYIFGTAVLILRTKKDLAGKVQYSNKAQLNRKYTMMTQRRIETHCTSLGQYDLISPDGKL